MARVKADRSTHYPNSCYYPAPMLPRPNGPIRNREGRRCCRLSFALLTALAVLLVKTGIAEPSAFRLYNQGSAASAQANAFTAQADDPSAIHYNPAGMTQLRGVQFYGGAWFVGGSTQFTSPTGVTTSGNFGNSVASPVPFNFYATANLGDVATSRLSGFTAGIGVAVPFGLVYQYPTTSPFATAVTMEQLPLIDIKPTLAYEVLPGLSIGLGADIYTFTGIPGSSGAFVQQLISSGGPGLPPAGTPLELNGKDTAAGFNVSVLYSPIRNEQGKPLANIGFVYRSQATLHLTGDFLANGGRITSASTTAVLPQSFTGGFAVWPVRTRDREWKLELDVDYTDWKSFRSTDVHLGTGTTILFPQNWRGGYTVMLGTEWKWLEVPQLPGWEVALRSGYWHAQAVVPDASYNPAVPDADQHLIAVGLGTLCKGSGRFFAVIPCSGGHPLAPKSIGLDLAYQVALYEPRTVAGNQNPVAIPGAINGAYHSTHYVGTFNIRLMF